MASKAKEYLRKGDEAILAAMDSHDPFARRTFPKLAGHWHELAERVEREQALSGPAEPQQSTLVPPSSRFHL